MIEPVGELIPPDGCGPFLFVCPEAHAAGLGEIHALLAGDELGQSFHPDAVNETVAGEGAVEVKGYGQSSSHHTSTLSFHLAFAA
jgi:hypothetical protein